MLQQIWCAILELSHNEAAAAFIGAGAAFFLVVANDWRRRRIRAFRSMPSRIQSLRFAAKQLITSGIDTLLVEPASTMDMMTDWMRPPLLGLRELAADVDDLLDEEERFAAQAIFFLLDSLNRNLDELERLTAAYFTKASRCDAVQSRGG
jgi:hypothetical protein